MRRRRGKRQKLCLKPGLEPLSLSEASICFSRLIRPKRQSGQLLFFHRSIELRMARPKIILIAIWGLLLGVPLVLAFRDRTSAGEGTGWQTGPYPSGYQGAGPGPSGPMRPSWPAGSENDPVIRQKVATVDAPVHPGGGLSPTSAISQPVFAGSEPVGDLMSQLPSACGAALVLGGPTESAAQITAPHSGPPQNSGRPNRSRPLEPLRYQPSFAYQHPGTYPPQGHEAGAYEAVANQPRTNLPPHAVMTGQRPGAAPFSQRMPAATLPQPRGNPHSVPMTAWNPHATATANNVASAHKKLPAANADSPQKDPHADVFADNCFPSATKCATCHKQIYDEWSISSHAYAAISPFFQHFEQKLNDLSVGTSGYFCMRCHAPVATTMNYPRDQSLLNGPTVFREGVTCVVCHRVKEKYSKTNGERRIEPGDLSAPVVASGNGAGLREVLANKDYYKVKVDPNNKQPGQQIHAATIQFEQLGESSYCASCHQVAVQPGIKLEVVWDQYRASPACKEGVTCQACHMGKVPGMNLGYSTGPAAVMNQRYVNPQRKHSNHAFYGPGQSIAHPGLFPFNPDAERWTPHQWLQFDWRGGWGTKAFEDAVSAGRIQTTFPPMWNNIDDRMDAREVLDANLKKLAYKNDLRRQVLENGSRLDGPFFRDAGAQRVASDLHFHFVVTNVNPGHNFPSGSLGAQPQAWLNVTLVGPGGKHVWESGYLDSNGDLADIHSLEVRARKVKRDAQLFNLQTRFLTTNIKGTDREMYLPINVDIDQIPFLRPGAQPISVINHPPFIRMEAHSIPPLGSRAARYVIPGTLLCEPGTYRISVRMRSRMEPIYFMRFCDATPEMERAMVEGIMDFHSYSATFEIR